MFFGRKNSDSRSEVTSGIRSAPSESAASSPDGSLPDRRGRGVLAGDRRIMTHNSVVAQRHCSTFGWSQRTTKRLRYVRNMCHDYVHRGALMDAALSSTEEP